MFFSRKPLTYNKPRTFKFIINEFANDPLSFSEYPSNFIRTSKYNIFNCLPKCLIMQFQRYANIYFLIIAVLQTFPQISPLHPFSAIAPLCFVLFLSMIREWIEDYERYKSDLEINKLTCKILINGVPIETPWSQVKVGHIILVKNNEMIPADMIILSSNFETGVAYIETSSLDGEKNLKIKLGLRETLLYGKTEKMKELEKWQVYAEVSNANLNIFDGVLIENNQKKHNCTIKQMLVRGSRLKNTQWVVGVVVYTGFDTKVMRNSEGSKAKKSNIEKKTNRYILGILLFQLLICFITTIASMIWNEKYLSNHFYLDIGKINNPYILGLYNFLTYFLLSNSMIPISLIVSLEFVKVCQAYFMSKDEDMYSKETKKYMKVMTASINEELGQVEYIFSDKTGTLTCNKMKFQGCIIGCHQYGYFPNEYEKNKSKKDYLTQKSKTNADRKREIQMPIERKKTIVDERSNLIFEFNDVKLKHIIKGICKEEENTVVNLKFSEKNARNDIEAAIFYEIKDINQLVHQFFIILATCHECIIEQDEKTSYMHYQSQSPDEISLVDAARHLGFKFLSSSSNQIKIDILGVLHSYELLHCFEFNSERKRMSIIVRDQGIVKLFMKGADSTVKSLLNNEASQPYKKFCEMKTDEYSKIGLRCLFIAMKVVSNKDYQIFLAQIQNKTNEQILELANLIEQDLILLGVTIVEDKLQEDVPETIQDLLMASQTCLSLHLFYNQLDIKFWMLTGDKLETAENIGKSCKLITSDMSLMRFCQKSIEEVSNSMDECLDIFKLALVNDKKIGCLVEGETLTFLLSQEDLKKKFVDISSACNAVICCRVTPKQKAEVVRLIKSHLNKITVAIGDGSNDVNMIQEAHIGIGIYGKEGLRAVQASDYAVGEFCCIWKLLLVHGRWSYIRISQMILYFFYKNMIVTIPQFFYGFLCAYSGQTIFDDWYITFYNMLFTVLPLIIRAIFDQDIYYKTYNKEESINKKICAKNRTKPTHFKEFFYLKKYYPSMYYIGQCNTIFTIKNFIYWIVQGWFHGILVFIICIYSHIKNVITESGFTSDLWSFSITMFSCIILMVDLKLALYTHSWTYLMGISLGLGSIVIYFIYVWIADQIIEFNIYKTASLAFSNPRNYLACLICLVSVVIFDVISIILKLEMTDSLVSYFKYLKNTEQGDVKEFYEIAMKRLLRKKKTSKRDNPNFQKEKKFNSSSDCSNQFFNKNKRKFYDEDQNQQCLVLPLKDILKNHSNPEFPLEKVLKREKLKFGKRKSRFSAMNNGRLSENLTEDICLKKANKMTDVIVLT